jgi:hypothetical protein
MDDEYEIVPIKNDDDDFLYSYFDSDDFDDDCDDDDCLPSIDW